LKKGSAIHWTHFTTTSGLCLRRLLRRGSNRHLEQDRNAPPQRPAEGEKWGCSRAPGERISRSPIGSLGDNGKGGVQRDPPPGSKMVPLSKVDRQREPNGADGEAP